MTKKVDDILRIIGEEEKLEGDQDEEQPEEKPEKKIKKFFSTSDRPQPSEKKSKIITTRGLPTFLPNYHGKKIN